MNSKKDEMRFPCKCGKSDLGLKVVCQHCNDENVIITAKDLDPILKRIEVLEKNHGR